MKEIDENITEEVNKITEELIVYKNERKLSWMGTYKDVLKKLNMEDRKDDTRLLTNVVTKITRLGYDIMDSPFKLDKFL